MSKARITYLEMLDPDALNPVAPPSGFWVKRIQPPEPELNAWFYRAVGGDWEWTDRLEWSSSDWRAYSIRDELLTFVGYQDDTAAGYFELERQPNRTVQLMYFGLLPEHIGKGLGGPMLSIAVQRAWALPSTRRVWVHTCESDHPGALSNYAKRGFSRFNPNAGRK